jgi:hypothetical protein
MLKIYLNYTYRDLEEWLLATDQVRQALQLTRVPDHTTLYRTFAKLSQAQWQQLNDALLQHLQVNEMTVAVDTTGFRTDTASAYYQSRCGRKRRSWHKGGFVVGTASQLIVGMRVGRGPGSDAPWLAPLRAQARRYVVRRGRSARFWLLADAGFDGRDVEWTDVVPPIRRGGRLRAWSRVLRAEIVERVKASGLYGQRWKVETVISVIKRKFGDGVRSRRLRLARCEVLAKGVVYNLHRSFCVVLDVWCVWWALRGGCRRSDWVSSQQSNTQTVTPIAPGRKAVVRWKIRAHRRLGEWRVHCALRAPETSPQNATSTLIVTDALHCSAQRVAGALWIRQGSDRTIGELRVGSRVVARMPHLGSVVVKLPDGSVQRLYARYSAPARRSPKAPVTLSGSASDRAGARWTFTLSLQALDAQTLRVAYACVPNRPREILSFEGPMLLVGDGTTADAKQEALFPGLEWLSPDEVSSSDLDIAKDHPDRVRFVPHPHKVTIPAMGVKTPLATVGLLWNMYDQWAKGQDRSQPVFAVPDRLQGTAAHRLGLIAPNVPAGLGENRLTAEKPFRVSPNAPLRLHAIIYVNPQARDALSVVDAWFAHFRPDPPLPAPQGDDLRQIAWSMKAYTDSLWVSDEEGWLPFQGGPAIWSRPAFRLDYVYDLLKALTILPNHPEASAWRAMVERTQFRVSMVGIPQAEDMQFEHGDTENTLSFLRSRALELMQSKNPDGSWGFDADRRDTGVFKGYDYHLLGPPDAVEVGTCARNAYEVLRYARISGSVEAYRAGAKTLEFMRRFTVPRAAQVWEVPVHTPDILAAADAIDAYIEGYWFSGDARWLAEARRWARAGLPFVYVWNAPGKPWMRYGSIPVFGATWYVGSWFGNIVQWNGLRYAYALIKLCETDRTAPALWKQVALGITRSAMYQQSTSGKNITLWPDSYHTITDVRAAWDFPPRQILKNVYHFLGREEEPRTLRLSSGIRISSRALKIQAGEAGDTLRVVLRHPKGERGNLNLLISGVSRPAQVLLQGQPLPEVERLTPESRAESCWKYSQAHRALVVWLATDAEVSVEVRGVQRANIPAFPRIMTELRFEFEEDNEGWEPANDLEPLQVRRGSLLARSTGSDPYMVRPLCRLDGDSIRYIRIRLRGTGNRGAQFYWTTLSSPGFDESKVIRFELPLDGEWHKVVLPVGEHPLWRGQTITGIRLDPGSAANTEVEIEWIRGESR